MDHQQSLRERYKSGTYHGKPLKNREAFVKAASEKGSSPEELNFRKNVIGSDETGKGEVFRPLIVVAAYVKKEHAEALIKEGIRDSKSYKTKEKLCEIGKKLTGFTSYADFEKQRESGMVMEKAYVTFAADVVSNGVYNQNWKAKEGGLNENGLMRACHGEVVNSLAKEVTYDYVVVDNFEESHPNHIQNEMNLPEDKMIIAKKADEFVLAVACASVIAKYLSCLYMEKLAADYGLDESEDFGRTGEFRAEMLERLWEKLENPRLFFKNYIKKFDNVINCLNEKEKGLGSLYDDDDLK